MATKFCNFALIKTTNYSSPVVQTRLKQIHDASRVENRQITISSSRLLRMHPTQQVS